MRNFEILNAKNHHREALIIAEAGAKGSVTISTNMAGRGTDIKLGGNPEFRALKKTGKDAPPDEYEAALQQEMAIWREQNTEVRELGGLYVLGTERHESRRIDNQLRGRSGRQGDPGQSRFFISLDDDLMRLFGGAGFRSTMSRLGMGVGEPLHHPLISKSLERAQKRVEDRNYEIRKHLLEYDDVVSRQRNAIYVLREEILSGKSLKDQVFQTGKNMLEVLLEDYESDKNSDAEKAFSRLAQRLLHNFNYSIQEELPDAGPELEKHLRNYLEQDLASKTEIAGDEQFELFIRYEYLRQIDQRWQEHLEEISALGESVRLRSYAQKNPLVEYKNEGFELFDAMLDDLRIAVARTVFRIHVSRNAGTSAARGPARKMTAQHAAWSALAGQNMERREARPQQVQVRRTEAKVGRNEPCPCGSGKKYKQCCGK